MFVYPSLFEKVLKLKGRGDVKRKFMKDRKEIVIEDEWFRTAEAAKHLKLSKGSFMNMVSNGQIPYYKLGRRNRYKKSELDNLVLSEKRGRGAYGYKTRS